ncbi:flagellar brake protein [Chitinimonas sp. BJB300]|uniref:flagellar brake protein n=1 Tax=Chitinimonas sp. BJB300 TaxID=1559339 RepID=UPI0013045B07|nr:PilZ domain-containing protein [Chitinimonas sp. BJB300]
MSQHDQTPEQRRAYYRLMTLEVAPLSCFVPVQGDEVEIDLVDLSAGGLGILGYMPGLLLRPGVKYRGIRIELPKLGTLVADIEIRVVNDITLRNGIRTTRSGAQFLNLGTPAQNLIQRYILQAERDRLAKLKP